MNDRLENQQWKGTQFDRTLIDANKKELVVTVSVDVNSVGIDVLGADSADCYVGSVEPNFIRFSFVSDPEEEVWLNRNYITSVKIAKEED